MFRKYTKITYVYSVYRQALSTFTFSCFCKEQLTDMTRKLSFQFENPELDKKWKS